ncbi:MAG: flagellar motor switch protein FliN [Chthoniobacter sp.]|jgi:flagellar motor switch protein FliN/FliY|nr:flagellar motor switch protein FliN [Chthoniobacter sp.]
MNAALESQNLKLVMDVKLDLTVRIGSTQLTMRDVMALTPGTVLQLSQEATEPVGLYVNEKLIALGEVVVVEDNFGIKITKLIGDES